LQEQTIIEIEPADADGNRLPISLKGELSEVKEKRFLKMF